jgi:hypothetical protein
MTAEPPTPASLPYIFTPFAGEDRVALQRFHQNIDRLKNWSVGQAEVRITAYPQPGVKSFSGGQGFKVTADLPPEEAVHGSLTLFRQIYTPERPTSANRLINLLSRHARERGTDVSRRMCEELRAQRKRLQSLRERDSYGALLVQENPFSDEDRVKPEAVLDMFFNGDVFHQDAEPADNLREGGDMIGAYRLSLHTAMKSHIEAWVGLGVLVEAILRDSALDGGSGSA